MQNKITRVAIHASIKTFLLLSAVLFITGCGPREAVQLKHIKDVVGDVTDKPRLKAEAVFYNPNNMSGRLRHVEVDVFLNGKKAAVINQDYKMKIPARAEFTVPIEAQLAMEELGLLNTVLGMIGGKKFEVRYVGKLKVSYHGLPITVPIDYKSDVRLKL